MHTGTGIKSGSAKAEPLYVTTDAEALEVPVVQAGVEAWADVEAWAVVPVA